MNKIAYKPEEAAEQLGVSVRLLEDWRKQGIGPGYSRIATKKIVYPHASLVKFLERHMVRTVDHPDQAIG
ncbi:MAG: helix-turn-helix domain-containing protein [Acidobacteriota bacterium]